MPTSRSLASPRSCESLFSKKPRVKIKPRAELKGLDLRKFKFARKNFSSSNLEEANLSKLKLTEAQAEDVNFNRANLQGSTLDKANFTGSSFMQANLSHSRAKRANFKDGLLVLANFEGANLRGADFRDAWLLGANFIGANLKGANLQGAILREIDMHVSTPGGYLVRQPIIDKKLMDAAAPELQRYNSGGALLTGALYNAKTTFPEWFNPKKYHMKFEE